MKKFFITCISTFMFFSCENVETEAIPDFLTKMEIVTFEQKRVNFKTTLEKIKTQPLDYVGYLNNKPYLDVRNLDQSQFTSHLNLVPLYNVNNNMRTAGELFAKLDEIGVSSKAKNIYGEILKVSNNIETYSLSKIKSKFNALITESRKLNEFEEIALTYQMESMLLVIGEIEDIVNEMTASDCVDMNKVVRDGIISGIISGIVTAAQGAIAGVHAAPANPAVGGVVGGLIGFTIGWEAGFWTGGIASIVSQIIDCRETSKANGAQFCLDQFCKQKMLIPEKVTHPELAVKTSTGEILFMSEAALNLQ